MGQLEDRIAIVTGGAQGLGAGYCRAFAAEGATVCVADLNGAKAREVAAGLGNGSIGVDVDVAEEASVEAMVATVVEELGTPAILVNNAALFGTIDLKPLVETSVREWDDVMAVNVRGPFLCTRAVAPAMSAAGYGKIVNTSSSTIWTGRPGYPHYVTSKMALIGMTRALAKELGPSGIRVNAVTPGPTRTEVERATMDDERWGVVAKLAALQQYARTDDIVGTVVFLAAPASDHMTGQTVNVDGGISLH
jgi:3-oxoacyl-[acyl-carrier protein] reductase